VHDHAQREGREHDAHRDERGRGDVAQRRQQDGDRAHDDDRAEPVVRTSTPAQQADNEVLDGDGVHEQEGPERPVPAVEVSATTTNTRTRLTTPSRTSARSSE
jgi:hypothetical protein